MTNVHQDYARKVADWWLERKDQWNKSPVPLIVAGIPSYNCPVEFPDIRSPSNGIEHAFFDIKRTWAYIDPTMEAKITTLKDYDGSGEWAHEFDKQIEEMANRPEADKERPMRITEDILGLSQQNGGSPNQSLIHDYTRYIKDISGVNDDVLKNFRWYEGVGASYDNAHNELVTKAARVFNRRDWKKYLIDGSQPIFSGSARVPLRLEGGEFQHTIPPDVDVVRFDPQVYTWDSIIGLEEVKAQIAKYFILPHVNPTLAEYLGTGYEGMVLVGPGGTGKTLLAQATAAQISSTFIEVKSVESMWRGESEKNMKDLFSLGRDILRSTSSHVILYFPEIDKILIGRDFQGHDQRVRSVMKAEIGATQTNVVKKRDGSVARLYVMGDTNQEDITKSDEALFRPGRLLAVKVGMPTTKDLEEIWKLYLGKYRVAGDVDASKLAKMSDGLTGADVHHGILRDKVPARILGAIAGGNNLSPKTIEKLRGIDAKTDGRFVLTEAMLEEALKEYRTKNSGSNDGNMFA